MYYNDIDHTKVFVYLMNFILLFSLFICNEIKCWNFVLEKCVLNE